MESKIKILSIFLCCAVKLVALQSEGSPCTDHTNIPGTCRNLFGAECKHVLLRKFQQLPYVSCDPMRDIVCCARRVTQKPHTINTSRKYIEECEKYKNLYDSEYTTQAAPPRTNGKTKCSHFSFPLVTSGENASPKEFPHMAVLGCKDKDGKTIWKCGGSLISRNYILSAAHCFATPPVDCVNEIITIARLGDLNIETDNDDAQPEEFNIINITSHHGYTDNAKIDDIALVKLDRDITMNSYIRPACLPYEDYSSLSQLVISGWGHRKFADTFADHLQKASIEQYPNSRCNDIFKIAATSGALDWNKKIVCAGSKYSKKDTCQGDSGGPLQTIHPNYPCLYSIIGVTSHGQACGNTDVPSIYTNVYNYIDWIESIVWS